MKVDLLRSGVLVAQVDIEPWELPSVERIAEMCGHQVKAKVAVPKASEKPAAWVKGTHTGRHTTKQPNHKEL